MSGSATSSALESVLDGCLEAVDEEILAVRDQLASRGLELPVPVSGGRFVDSSGAGFLYEWALPHGDFDIRPDDAVAVDCAAGESHGFVLSRDRAGRLVRIGISEWLGRSPGEGVLEFDPSWLLTSLAHRLETIRSEPAKHHVDTVLRTFGRVCPATGDVPFETLGAEALNDSQRAALRRLLGSEVQFVWGPPGTGKTRLLGRAVAELAAAGPVLVAATTNGAVDEAAVRVREALGADAVRANRVIRVGARFSATGDPDLSVEAALERRVVGSGSRFERSLEEVEAELGIRGKDLGPVRGRVARAAAAAKRLGDEAEVIRTSRLARDLQVQAILALRDADVVLTTFARLALWDELASLRFDALVIDEASTAPLPYVALAAALTRGRVVAIGDFQQLPAVVVSRGTAAARWLRRDLFREAGLVGEAGSEPELPSERDLLCSMLDEQYRMAPPIRSVVSDLFYGGRLRDAKEVLDRVPIAAPLLLFDTESAKPVVERVDGSRVNAAHLEVMVGLLELLGRCGLDEIAVMTPYRAQSRRLRETVRGRLGRAAPAKLEIATIHRFQGREKRVVVLDTVDAPPGRSWFLNEQRNPDLPRLLNVALSRARDGLILIGSVGGLRATLPRTALLNRIIAEVAQRGVVLSPTQLTRAARLFDRTAPVA